MQNNCAAQSLRYGTVAGKNCFEGSGAATVISTMNNRNTDQQYRDMAGEIGRLARRIRSEEVREELLLLAEQYERLAAYVEEWQVIEERQTENSPV